MRSVVFHDVWLREHTAIDVTGGPLRPTVPPSLCPPLSQPLQASGLRASTWTTSWVCPGPLESADPRELKALGGYISCPLRQWLIRV